MNLETVIEGYLLYLVLPIWVAVGAADWLCHKLARIELSTGPLESVIHLLMLGEVGVAVLAALLLEINGTVLIVLFVIWLLHEGTSYWDLHYASSRRAVPPWEQRVHDYLAVIPLLALILVSLLHWQQLLAVFGLGSEPFDRTIRWKEDPLSLTYLTLLIAAIFCFNLLPFISELVRCLAAVRRRPAEPVPTRRRSTISQR